MGKKDKNITKLKHGSISAGTKQKGLFDLARDRLVYPAEIYTSDTTGDVLHSYTASAQCMQVGLYWGNKICCAVWKKNWQLVGLFIAFNVLSPSSHLETSLVEVTRHVCQERVVAGDMLCMTSENSFEVSPMCSMVFADEQDFELNL